MIWKSAFLSLLFPVVVAAQTAELLSQAKKKAKSFSIQR